MPSKNNQINFSPLVRLHTAHGNFVEGRGVVEDDSIESTEILDITGPVRSGIVRMPGPGPKPAAAQIACRTLVVPVVKVRIN